MEKYKYLFKNIGLMTLGNFATKLLSFFLVPLYTNILSTSEYGTYDLYLTIINVLVPILTLNIADAVLRFPMEEKYDKTAIVTVASKYFLRGTFFVIVILLINYFFEIYTVLTNYSLLFFLMFVSQSFSGIILAYTRGSDHISDLTVSSVISSFVTIILNIVFLLVLKMGLIGYFWANIIGPVAQSVYLFLKLKIYKKINTKEKYFKVRREMSKYSKPLIVNNIAWWINNASDRFVVVWFCGLAENGIYSVASKIPSILNIFQTIFNQAWSLSAVKDYDPEDNSNFFSNTYNVYNTCMVLLCSLIILFDKILSKFLYSREFYTAWQYVPWLTIAILFGGLSGYLGGFFSAVKNTKVFAQSTLIGALLNILLNILLTPILGALGAAIATAFSFFIVWAIRYKESKKFILLRVKIGGHILSYIILCIQAVVLLLVSNLVLLYILEIFFFLVLVVIYYSDLSNFMKKILFKLNRGNYAN